MTLILWCLQYLQQRKLERLERVSKRFTGSEYFPYSTVSLQLSHPTINTTMDQFLFLLKTKFLDLDGVNGLTLTRFPSSVSSLHCFRLSIRLVHRLCQSFKCGSLKCRLSARLSAASASTSVAGLVLSVAPHTLCGRVVVLAFSGLDVAPNLIELCFIGFNLL